MVALDTGMRQGEMLALRFGNIDWLNQVITLRGETTKSGLTRRVPIATARLKSVLEWLQLDVAGEKKSDEAKSTYLHWHDLRHEYASRLVEKGAVLPQVRDLLGHASIDD